MSKKYTLPFIQLPIKFLVVLVSGFLFGILGAVGLGNVISSLFMSIISFVILVNFVKIDREKNNFWIWFKKNLIILICVYFGVGWLFLTLFGIVGENGSGSIFTLIAFLIFTPMAVYVARKGN